MTIDMSQFIDVFFDEATEHLATMESLLLQLDQDQPDDEALNAIFRAAHSIKGGAATFGFADLAEVTHVLENLLDRLRRHELVLQPVMVDVFLRAGDVLRNMLDAHRSGVLPDQVARQEVTVRLELLAKDAISQAPPPMPAPVSRCKAAQGWLKIAPGAKCDLLRLRSSLAVHGEIHEAREMTPEQGGAYRMTLHGRVEDMLSELEFAIAPELICWESEAQAVQGSTVSVGTDTLECVAALENDDPGYGLFDEAPGISLPAAACPEGEGYGFFLEESDGDVSDADPGYGFFVSPEMLPAQAEDVSPACAGPVVRADGRSQRSSAEPESVSVLGAAAKPAVPKPSPPHETSIRVGVEKVDQLLNLVGELVITQSMLAQNVELLDPALYGHLISGVQQLERNTRELQESVMSIRMLPISSVFNRFPRLVHDLAAKLDKKVELKMLGEHTELDKGFIEKLADPLTHLVRNSLDHGIEDPAVRLAAGKTDTGILTLKAFHRGGSIVIEVRDDGAGLSRERILAKARERGMPISDTMTDSEVWQLIFEAGFSTANVVTDVSGRGVGMDVVRRNIQGMGGRIEIESMQGVGSTISIRLPLTLAILDGMSIQVGAEIYIIPLSFIVESLQPSCEMVRTVAAEGKVINVRGEYLPIVPLHDVFHVTPRVTEWHQGLAIIVEADGQKIALFVDDLLGQHQVVVKNLETNYRRVAGVAGATIMGDGRVAFILDVSALVRLAQAQPKHLQEPQWA